MSGTWELLEPHWMLGFRDIFRRNHWRMSISPQPAPHPELWVDKRREFVLTLVGPPDPILRKTRFIKRTFTADTYVEARESAKTLANEVLSELGE